MTATAPTPRDLLVEARTLIAKPEAWTQGAAVSWCATGAINCAMYRHLDSLEVPPPLQRARERAGTILTDTVRALTLGHYTEATTYNDQTNHGCIVHAFDIAIADADRHCGKHSSGPHQGQGVRTMTGAAHLPRTIRNPYRVPRPAVISFSGGRTSSYMLKKIVDAYDGWLPSDIAAVYANTGMERPETLEFVDVCGREWGVDIVWVEYLWDAPHRTRVVEFATASRNGEPYAALIDRKGFVPEPHVASMHHVP